MKREGKLARYVLSLIVLCHGAMFLLITYILFAFEQAFHSQWILENIIWKLVFLIVGVLFLWIAYLLFKMRRWARALAAIALSGTLVWLLYSFFTGEPFKWYGVLWLTPSIVGLGFLPMLPTEVSARPTEKLA